MKRIIAAVICLMLMCGAAFGEAAAPAGMIPVEMAFTTPSDEFSVATAWYVLTSFLGQGQEDTAALMENAGLTVVMQENYGKPMTDHSHTSAFTLAVGQLPVRGEARNVAVISVRGTGDGEWYSNFDFAGESMGECLFAENFMAASEQIYASVAGEIAAIEDPVIIVTGYSRGAACANLLGVMFNYELDSEDIYVYTYATPNTVRGELPGHGNIFNLVNVNDAITGMPLEVWGFSRAGVDIELRDPDYVNVDMHIMFMEMLGVCPDIDSYYLDRHSMTQPGLADDGITMYELLSGFAGLMSGDEQASMQSQQLIMGLSSAENDFSAFLPKFVEMLMPAEGTGVSPLLEQHMPTVYAELMMGL